MTNQQSLDQDSLARNQIVNDIERNFFVEAGAGSGKTTMLVNRMAAMVEADCDISRICAITFTKAAAGEFRNRFQKILSDRSDPDYKWQDTGEAGQLPLPTDDTRTRCAQALQNIDLCFMGTIDSFCSMILSEHPYEAGLPTDSHIITDGEMETFVKQMYVKICNGEYDENNGNGETLSSLAHKFSMFYRNAEEVFVRGMTLFMNNRNVHFNFNPNVLSDNIDQEYAAEKNVLIRTVGFLVDHQELQYDKGDKNTQAWNQITDIYNNIIGQWNYNLPNVLYSLKTLSEIHLVPEAENKFKTEIQDLFDPHRTKGKNPKTSWLAITIGSPNGVYTRLEEHRYSATMTFLEACTPIIEKAMRDKGYLSFFDCLYYLRNMLRKDAEGDGRLIRHIYERHSYFLIDEFQDTNPLQAEIFFYLTAEHPVAQWSCCVPRQGSLFIVGDPKQSIYRFRSADVTSFLNVKQLFNQAGGTILKLTRNFRSTRELCEFYNRVFAALLPQETDNQSKFEAIPLPVATVNEFQGIYTYQAYAGSAADAHPDETDPVRIEQIIETLAYHNEFKITVDKDEGPREIKYSDIMVITYGKKNLAPIMEHLANRGIPTKVEGKVPFSENAALTEVYKIYATIADPDDPASLYGALHGSLFHFTWKDILVFINNKGILSIRRPQNLVNSNDSIAHSVSERIGQLHAFYEAVKNMSPAALFSRIIDEFKIYETVEAEDLEVLYYTLELLRNAEKSGQIVSLKDGNAYIADLLNDDTDEERCLSLNDKKECVRMANLHKVKGLEAPIVILAAASDRSPGPTIRVQHDSSEGWIFTLESERDAEGKATTYCKTGLFSIDDKANNVKSEKTKEDEALKAEEKRLIYVAATRARNALITCRRFEIRKGNEILSSKWKPISEGGLQDFFKNVGNTTNSNRPTGIDVNAEQLYKDAEQDWALKKENLDRGETATYEVKRPSEQRAASKMDDEQDVVVPTKTTETDETTVDKNAAKNTNKADNTTEIKSKTLFGTMVHKLMEMLVTTRNQIEPEELIKEIISEYTTPSTEDSEKENMRASLTQVAATMRNGGYEQKNSVPQDLLTTLLDADTVYCEVPFCYKEKETNTLWSGTMDVVYCSEGKWHIVDYKTKTDGKAGGLDEKYQGQLTAYKIAFNKITKEHAEALTYRIDA